MAEVVISMRVMPTDVKVSIDIIKKRVHKIIEEFIENSDIRVEKQPIAFGLVALGFLFAMKEDKNLEELEDLIKKVKNVQNVEITDVRRAVG